MSKELTEQWQNGTLPRGSYYIKLLDGSIKQTNYDNINKTFDTEYFRYNVSVKEVLVLIPSYTDLCELKQELEICKDEKADLYAKLCNALMQLESKNNQFVELTEKVGELSSENGRLKYDNDVLSTVNDELTEKVHILNEANMQLENAIGSQADFFRQQISVLESQLSEANEVIKFYSDATGLTEEERQMSSEKYHLVYGLKACDYLEKWKV